VAVLAAEGMTSVPVQRPLRAAVLSTGTELVLPEHTPEPHQIRASNRAAIEAELHAAGLEVVPGRYSTDDEAELETAIRELADSVELLLLCGGVSRGRYDFIEATLEKLGARTLFHWVAQKPGKPLLCAEHSRGPTLILGLPGNPQSALIGARRYAVEAARRRAGEAGTEELGGGSGTPHVALAENLQFDKDKTLFQPAALREGRNGPEAVPVRTTGSGDYFGLSRADGFLELPAQRNEFAAGERYPFYGWSCR
jgi:molybdopterin molybdotransferase